MRKIPVRHPHKASGQDRCRFQGKDYYFGPTGSAESDKRYAQWVHSLLDGQPALSTKVKDFTVGALLLRFLQMAEKRYAAGEVSNIKQMAKLVLAKHRNTRISAFGPKALIEIRDDMVAAGWPRERVNSQVGRVRRAFRWGVSQELVHIHTALALREILPLRAGQTPAPETKPVPAAKPGQVAAVLKQLCPTLATMVQVHQLVGCRPGDLFIMRPMDIDRTDKVWVYRPARHKGTHLGKVLGYAIGPKAQKLLKPFLKCRPDEYLFRPAETIRERREQRKQSRKSKVTPSQKARQARSKPREVAGRYNRFSYRRALQRAVRRITGDDDEQFAALYFAPNQLRHAKATAVRAEHGIEAARIALGHSDIKTTLIYAEADLELAKKIARQSG